MKKKYKSTVTNKLTPFSFLGGHQKLEQKHDLCFLYPGLHVRHLLYGRPLVVGPGLYKEGRLDDTRGRKVHCLCDIIVCCKQLAKVNLTS